MHADDDNHTLFSAGNGLRHSKCEAPLIDLLIVLLVNLVKHREQADAHNKEDGDCVDDTDLS